VRCSASHDVPATDCLISGGSRRDAAPCVSTARHWPRPPGRESRPFQPPMAARHFPCRGVHRPRHPARPAAFIHPTTADDCRRGVSGISARLRAGRRADQDQRGSPERSTAVALPERISIRHAATIGELWAWPGTLKLALVEHVYLRASVLARLAASARAADEIVGPLARPGAAVHWPGPVLPALDTRLLQRFREYGDRASALQHQLIALLDARGETVEDAILAKPSSRRRSRHR
jgi:hypothetical protein